MLAYNAWRAGSYIDAQMQISDTVAKLRERAKQKLKFQKHR